MVNFRTSTRITAQLVGATGIDVTRENGIYTVSLDLAELTDFPSIDAEDEAITSIPLFQEDDSGVFYGKMTWANLRTEMAASLSAVYQPLDATLTAWAGVTFAADKLGYATGADAFATTDLTAAGRAILDDADAAAQRATLGLVIGTNVQAFDADLAAIAGLTSAADKVPYFTGGGTAAVADFSSFGRSLVDDADASAARTTLGLVIGTNVQAQDAELAALAGLTSAADKLPYFTGSGTAGVTDFSAFARTLLDDADAAAARTTLGVGTGVGDLVSTNNLSDVANAATAFGNIKQAASETATGVVELATSAEVSTGTDTTRAVTPAGVTSIRAVPRTATQTSGTSVDLSNLEVVYFNYASPATISTFTGIVIGKVYTLINVSANAITIDRTTCLLDGSTNKVLTNVSDSIQLCGSNSGTTLVQVSPVLANG